MTIPNLADNVWQFLDRASTLGYRIVRAAVVEVGEEE